MKKFLFSKFSRAALAVLVLGLGAYFGVDTSKMFAPEPVVTPAPMPVLFHGRVVDAGK